MKTLSLLFAVVSLFPCAQAAVLLEVDVSDPGAVIFSSTSAVSEVDDGATLFVDGISLLDFFDPASAGIDETFMDIYDLENTDGYVAFRSADFGSGATALNLYRPESGSAQIFSTLARALTGSATLDLTGEPLPIAGTTGNIIVGSEVIGSGAVIGQWIVLGAVPLVPEPTRAMLFALAAFSAVSRRRRLPGA